MPLLLRKHYYFSDRLQKMLPNNKNIFIHNNFESTPAMRFRHKSDQLNWLTENISLNHPWSYNTKQE